MAFDPSGNDYSTSGSPSCLTRSTAIAQQALAYLGVNETLANISSATSPLEFAIRSFYQNSVAYAMRTVPWPCFTKYADLVWIAGTVASPVNDDWIYTYRYPSDAVYIRRVIRFGAGRKFDPDPPKFRPGVDTTGRLVFTDFKDPAIAEGASQTLPVEYTFRPDCAAEVGDDGFREALAWHLAYKLAPGLSRNKISAAECYGMFLRIGQEATAVSANESERHQDEGDAPWLRERGLTTEDFDRR